MIRTNRPVAKVRLLNSSADVGSIDVQMNGGRAFTRVSYGQLTDYVPVAAGERTIKVYQAGAHDQPLMTIPMNLHNDDEITLAMVGHSGQLEALVIDDETPPAAEGRVRIRLLNVGPDIGPVDLSVKGGTDIFRNVSYKEVSGFAEVPTGTVDLEITPAGESKPVQTIHNYRLAPYGRYTIVVLNRGHGAQPADIVPIEDRRGLEEKAG
jgi:hypothetical protein